MNTVDKNKCYSPTNPNICSQESSITKSSSKPNSHFDANEISQVLQNMKVHYYVDQSQLLESILSKINLAHTCKLFL